MRSIRPPFTTARRAALATGLVAALALSATACGGGDEDKASDAPSAQASAGGDQGGGDKSGLPDNLKDQLKKHGIDTGKWADGGWKDWSKDKWLRDAKDFVNPVIKGLWNPERMKSAKDPSPEVGAKDYADQGMTDPAPQQQNADAEKTPYHEHAAPVGKLFFDSPEGHMVCSGTVVKDPRHPGKSNLVWTAGHCVHAGAGGGWYRNLVFVPAYNDLGKSESALASAQPQEVYPYGQFWADWVSTSNAWIQKGAHSNTDAFSYDYAVMHVQPEQGSKSLEETVGASLDVDFSAPAVQSIGSMGAWGYPAAPPYNGQLMYDCNGRRPGRLSLGESLPTMYRIGCSMTGGSSGGGWFRVVDGETKLVSNTSMGPDDSSWLAGPQLGDGAKDLYNMMSEKYGAQ